MRYVTVPGYGGSGAGHWQTHWEGDLPATRFRPGSWDQPDAPDWSGALGRAVRGGKPVLDGEAARDGTAVGHRRTVQPGTVLVAHSLGCLTVASWLAENGPGDVVGALLVAVPDSSGPEFPAAATAGGFQMVRRRLPVPVTVVASSDDPYATPDRTRDLAAIWGAEVIEAGAVGHLNDASGLGAWPDGREILRGLVQRSGERRA